MNDVQLESSSIILAIDNVIAACQQTLESKGRNDVVAKELDALTILKALTIEHWPLSMDDKSKINIGVVAARNLSDWVPNLAGAIMVLDYAIKHDGSGIEKLQAPIAKD